MVDQAREALGRDVLAVSAVFRRSSGYEADAEYQDALVFSSGELSERLRVHPDEFAAALNAWLVERGDPERSLEVRRTHTAIGAEAVTVAFVLTLIAGAAAEIGLEELYRFLKARLLPPSMSAGTLEYLLSLQEADLAEALRAQVAYATDRRRSDLTTVQVKRETAEVSGVFDTPAGARYVIRATGDLFLIRLVEKPAR